MKQLNLKLNRKKAYTCPLCLKRIKGTSGKYTEAYRNMMFNEHLGKFHPETGVIST